MTTIAYKAGMLASDQCMTDSGGVKSRYKGKIRRLQDGRLAAFAGDLASGVIMIEWAETMVGKPKPRGDADMLVITLDGSIVLFDRFGAGILIEDDQYAIGSGSAMAMGAMLAGASAERAVEICLLRDGNSGFGVTALHLDGTKPTKKRPTK